MFVFVPFAKKKQQQKKKHVFKTLVLEIWSNILKTNQNACFFEPQYLTKNFTYEVDYD